MSATHKRAGVSWALDCKRLLGLMCVVIGVAALSLSPAAAAPAGDVTSRYVAPDLERVVGVEFRTPEQPVRYTVRIYADESKDQPGALLFEWSGDALESGYYALPVDPSLPLVKDQSLLAVVSFLSPDGSAEVAPGTSAYVNLVSVPEGTVPEATTIQKFAVTPPPVIAGTPMTFTVSATGTTAGDALTYVIDYGDGTALVAAAPLCTKSPVVDCVTAAHTYAKAGTFAAKLTVTDTVDQSTVTSLPLNVVVQIPVTAEASSTCGLVPLNVCFTGGASNGTPPYTYTWTFGDGSPVSHEQNPCHAYTTAKPYTVVLSVTDSVGATGTSTPITINALLPLTVNLTTASNITDGIPVLVVNFCVTASNGLAPYTYAWDFGDGMTATNVLCPQHAYPTVGTYTVTVTVTDSCEETVTKTLTITVHTAPWIRITSPANGSVQHAEVTLNSTVVVETGVRVTRVEYYANGVLLGFATTAPYTLTWDTRGLNGSYSLTAIAYDSLGRSNATETAVVITISNPTVDGRVVALGNPFRLQVFGNFFQKGCTVYINDIPAPASVVKSSTLVVAKGGSALKALIPKGVPVIITVKNPDLGLSLGSTFLRR